MGGGSKRNVSKFSLTHMPYTTGKKIGEEDGSNRTIHSVFPLPYIDMRWGMGEFFRKEKANGQVGRSGRPKTSNSRPWASAAT